MSELPTPDQILSPLGDLQKERERLTRYLEGPRSTDYEWETQDLRVRDTLERELWSRGWVPCPNGLTLRIVRSGP
jgi:hypothetical protein